MAAYSSEVVPRIRVFRSRYFLSDISTDHSGVLEGEQLVKGSSGQGNLWFSEQPVVYHDSKSHSKLDHSCLRPIGTTLFPDPSSERKFQDRTVLSHPESHSITMQIYVSRICPNPSVLWYVSICLIAPTPHTTFCVGPTSTADIRATRISRTIHDYEYAQR